MFDVSAPIDLLTNMLRLITHTLLFQRDVFVTTAAGQTSAALIGVAIVAGASLLIGQSTILFINHVTPARLALTMVINSFITVIGWALWALLIWLIARYTFHLTADLFATIRLVTLGSVPFVFGFLILTPYFGSFIEHVLRVWSLLLLLDALIVAFGATFLQACMCAGIGWAVLQIFNSTIGRLLTPLRERLWQLVTGTTYHYTSANNLIALFITPTEEMPRVPQR